MKKQYLIVFDQGKEIRLKPCGCTKGKVRKENILLRDIYSFEECIEIGEDPDDILESNYVCENCEEKLEEII